MDRKSTKKTARFEKITLFDLLFKMAGQSMYIEKTCCFVSSFDLAKIANHGFLFNINSSQNVLT